MIAVGVAIWFIACALLAWDYVTMGGGNG